LTLNVSETVRDTDSYNEILIIIIIIIFIYNKLSDATNTAIHNKMKYTRISKKVVIRQRRSQ